MRSPHIPVVVATYPWGLLLLRQGLKIRPLIPESELVNSENQAKSSFTQKKFQRCRNLRVLECHITQPPFSICTGYRTLSHCWKSTVSFTFTISAASGNLWAASRNPVLQYDSPVYCLGLADMLFQFLLFHAIHIRRARYRFSLSETAKVRLALQLGYSGSVNMKYKVGGTNHNFSIQYHEYVLSTIIIDAIFWGRIKDKMTSFILTNSGLLGKHLTVLTLWQLVGLNSWYRRRQRNGKGTKSR